MHAVAIGRRSTYFPSPPESAEPPIIPEPLPESEPESELKPEPKLPDPEPHNIEEEEPEMPHEQTTGYEWPLNSPSDGCSLKANKV